MMSIKAIYWSLFYDNYSAFLTNISAYSYHESCQRQCIQVEPRENDTPIITIVIVVTFIKIRKIFCNFIKIDSHFAYQVQFHDIQFIIIQILCVLNFPLSRKSNWYTFSFKRPTAIFFLQCILKICSFSSVNNE